MPLSRSPIATNTNPLAESDRFRRAEGEGQAAAMRARSQEGEMDGLERPEGFEGLEVMNDDDEGQAAASGAAGERTNMLEYCGNGARKRRGWRRDVEDGGGDDNKNGLDTGVGDVRTELTTGSGTTSERMSGSAEVQKHFT
ncbi:hypothetical protein HK104_004775 [Borealophlyctis nickersoniae]|nr:hypothetical protein HK104_004775 [Borealophlyctis nickersoniae]